jgi:hypothetical protein
VAARRRVGAHERAVRKDLARIPAEDRAGGTAALALELARRLDGGGLSSRDLATISAQFHAVLLTLAKHQEAPAVLDPIDELAKARRRRLGSAAG